MKVDVNSKVGISTYDYRNSMLECRNQTEPDWE